ncbi:MAG: hypothetical protein AB1393_08995 [Candidatus Edwardsbacteria bacterium]
MKKEKQSVKEPIDPTIIKQLLDNYLQVSKAVKEEIDTILKEPATKENVIPSDIAYVYNDYTGNIPLSLEIKIDSELPIALKKTTLLEKFVNKMRTLSIVKKHPDLRDEFEKIRNDAIIKPLQEGFEGLSEETTKLLKDNYDEPIRKVVIKACIDFSDAIKFEFEPDLNTNAKQLKSKYSRNLKKYKQLLSDPFLIDLERQIIETIKQSNEFRLKEIREVSIDPVKALELNRRQTIGLLSPYNLVEWTKEYYIACEKLILKKQVGRPRSIFYKALQIVIYKLLTVNRPRKIKNYKVWAMEFTANIINEFCKDKNLPKLKRKDIKNTLCFC